MGAALPRDDPGRSPNTSPEVRFRLSIRWRVSAAGTLLLVGAIVGGVVMHLPYYSIQPGPAKDVAELVRVRNEPTFPSKGAFLLTTVAVSFDTVSAFEGVVAWFDPATELVPREHIVFPGLDDDQQDELNRGDMLQSKYAAAVVALRLLGRDVPRTPGARVLQVLGESDAEKKIEEGDIILAIDDSPVAGLDDVGPLVLKHRIGEAVRIRVSRDDGEKDVVVKTSAGKDEKGKPRPVIGVSLVPAFAFPVDIQINTEDIGGPSGGLVFALAILDVLSPGDLTKGRRVAATGTIEIDGKVGEVGGVEQKVLAAERTGADVFLVPASELSEARRAARDMRVIGVETLGEALEALEGLGLSR